MLDNTTDDDKFNEILGDIWSYLAPSVTLVPTDVLFVFGGLDLSIPRHAAEIFKTGQYSHIIVSGSTGPLTSGVFLQSEARTFADAMISQGVPSNNIIVEEKAKNTGENVKFGIQRAKEMGVIIESATLVSKSFLMRRALLTFKKQYPSIVTIPSPPPGPPSMYVDRPKVEFAQRIIAEVDRLIEYESLGFISHASIPHKVKESVQLLRARLNIENQ